MLWIGSPWIYHLHKGEFFWGAFFDTVSLRLAFMSWHFLTFIPAVTSWPFGSSSLRQLLSPGSLADRGGILGQFTPLTRLWRSVSDMTGVNNLRYFWLFSTMILAPLALMVMYNSGPVIICSQACFVAVSVNFVDPWNDDWSKMIGNILQSLCNVWIVGSLLFSSLNRIICCSGYAIYFLIASGCSCRGACTPSQDQRRKQAHKAR